MTEATVGEADDSSTEIIQPKERKKKKNRASRICGTKQKSNISIT